MMNSQLFRRVASVRGLVATCVLAAAVYGLGADRAALAEKPAHAGKSQGGKGDGGKRADQPQQGGPSVEIDIVFDDGSRTEVRDYYRTGFGGKSCPPGLAKKRNGCLPPGQAKQRYQAGAIVPDHVRLEPLPAELEIRLKVLPRGYVYRYVDGEVLVLAAAARKVIDAMVLLSTL